MIAPFETPSTRFEKIRVRFPSVLRSWMTSRTSGTASAAKSPKRLIASRITSPRRRTRRGGGLVGAEAASIGTVEVTPAEGTAGAAPSPVPASCLLLRDDLLLVLRHSCLDRVEAVVRERRVAVLVDRVRPDDRLAVLRVEERLDDGGAIVGLGAGALQRVEGQSHRLVPVDPVRVDRLDVVRGLVLLEDRAGLRQVLHPERRDRELHPLADARRDALLRRVGERLLGDAVRAVELRRRVRRGDVLVDLDAVLARDAAPEEAVALGVLRLRAVVGRVAVGALLVAGLHALFLHRLLDVLRDARAVRRLVVPDVDRLAAVLLHDGRESGALDHVARHGPRIGPAVLRDGRVVLLRLTGLRAGLVRRQPDVRVGRRDLRNAALVEDRQRDLRAAGVELTQVEDRALVADRLAGVLLGLAVVGRARVLRRRVVERHVLDGVLADLAADVLQGELLTVDDGEALTTRGALKRQARVDGQVSAADLAAGPAARAATAGGDPQGERPGRAKRYYGTSPHSISSKIGWGLMIGGMLVGKADGCVARWINCRRRISAVPSGASG